MSIWDNIKSFITKENPAQESIAGDYGTDVYTSGSVNYLTAFKKIEVVNRGVTMIVDGSLQFNYDIKENKLSEGIAGLRQKTLDRLLNYKPNPYQDVARFRQAIYTDYILEGNIFIYWDGVHIYHLPAANVQIQTDPKTFVKSYTYNNDTTFYPNEIIHIMDTSSQSIYRGDSRLQAADRSIKTLYKMQSFQDNFFDNGAITGVVLETDNTLSQVAKDRTIQYWISKYSPKNGAKKPLIIDGGLKLKTVNDVSFKELDFEASVTNHEIKILKALGIPPILMEGGNNANISPNLRLFYLETVLPIVRKTKDAFERFFGFDLEVITSNVTALQPELKEIASYYSTMVNTGIITPNEAREALRYAKIDGADELRIPANIAGSAANPSEGGRPSNSNKE
jgi:HK97 family phage portal protein